MNTTYRQQRKAEILALSQNALSRRGTRNRTLRRVVGTSAALVLVIASVLLARVLAPAPVPNESRITHVLPPVEIPTGNPPHNTDSPEPSWVVHAAPLRDDQIIKTRADLAGSIATDADLMQCLLDTGSPGLVRVKGQVFAAFELLPPDQIPQPHPPGSGPIPTAPDSPKATLIAAL